VILCSVLALSACDSAEKTNQTQPDASMGMLNDTCPISGQEVEAGDLTADVKGGTIGFCCPKCLDGWNKKSKSEQSDYVAGLGK